MPREGRPAPRWKRQRPRPHARQHVVVGSVLCHTGNDSCQLDGAESRVGTDIGTTIGADMDEQYDVVVVGGGAAGLSGALALSRARRSVLVGDGGAPRNARAARVHNYLGRESTPPAELLAIGRTEVAGYGGRFRDG